MKINKNISKRLSITKSLENKIRSLQLFDLKLKNAIKQNYVKIVSYIYAPNANNCVHPKRGPREYTIAKYIYI